MIKSKILIALLLSTTHLSITAGEVDIPNTFSAGTPAVAAEVNGNFTAVETAVDGNAVDIAAVLATVTAMEARLATLEADVASLQTDNTALVADNTLLQNFITEVIPYLEGGIDGQGNQAVFFSGANVHVNNGDIDNINGLGNLIVGYDRHAIAAGEEFCTAVDEVWSHAYTVQVDCESNGGVWGSNSQKIGSHYVVVGGRNSYTQYGGIVSGLNNVANGGSSSVFGGRFNIASGAGSNIYGGQSNLATGFFSNIVAGRGNVSSGSESNVTGGADNVASGTRSSVSGGQFNTASGQRSSISGGRNNLASGTDSSVSGGNSNDAIGLTSSISGGNNNEASADESSVSGGFNNEASGNRSSVSGGSNGTASGADDWVAGTLFEDN